MQDVEHIEMDMHYTMGNDEGSVEKYEQTVEDKKLKILAVVGTTSAGKSELAVKLARRFNGEIISCDSRQIYKGMDLGTGKVEGKWRNLSLFPSPGFGPLRLGNEAREGGRQAGRGRTNAQEKIFVYKNIPHHLIDFVSPKRQYSVGLFQKKVKKIIKDILKRGKLPILCGGTMQWID